MLLTNSFSQTKIFFQKSIQTFKSFLSNGYTKLPKSPPFHCTFNPFSCTRAGGGSDIKFSHSYRELDSFYAEYTNNHRHAAAGNNKETAADQEHSTPTTTTETTRLENQESIGSTNVTLFRENYKNRKGKGKLGKEDEEEEEERMSVVKLRELEMMDRGNVEHVLDIEEIFHYYSRLTCPTYRAIVDKFFAEMYSDFSCLPAAASGGGVSVARRRPVMRQRRPIKV